MTTLIKEQYKKKIADELENNGSLSLIKSKLKSQMVEIIKNEKREVKRKLDFEMLTPFQKISKSKELMLLTHLIIEYLQFYELDYTCPVFKGETNIKESVKKETLIKDSNLKKDYDENEPILLQVLKGHLNDRIKGFPSKLYDDPFFKKDKEVSYSGLGLMSGSNTFNKPLNDPLANINLTGLNKNTDNVDGHGEDSFKNKKLSPLNFGNSVGGELKSDLSGSKNDDKEKSKYFILI